MHIDQILDTIFSLPEDVKTSFKTFIREERVGKDKILLRADRVEQKMYFVKKGIVRAYSFVEDKEITFWFGKEGDTVISMRSYVENEKGYETVEMLEDGELYSINTDDLQELYKSNVYIANWGRKLIENELIKTEKRLISQLFQTATERYKELLTDTPHLLQRVSLGHIASYLGISQVSLSRIRSDIK